MKKNDYEYVENLVKLFFEADEFEKRNALEEIIECFKPLIIRLMFKYYKKYDEYIMQFAILELIERTSSYDYLKYDKFCAYLKHFMELFFRRMYFKDMSRCEDVYEDTYINNISIQDSYSIEIDSIMSVLDEKQRYIIENNVIYDKKLKTVARQMNISYVYAKKLKKMAIDTMKSSMYA